MRRAKRSRCETESDNEQTCMAAKILEEARGQAAKVLEEGREHAAKILEEAEAKAGKILEDAEREAKQIKGNRKRVTASTLSHELEETNEKVAWLKEHSGQLEECLREVVSYLLCLERDDKEDAQIALQAALKIEDAMDAM